MFERALIALLILGPGAGFAADAAAPARPARAAAWFKQADTDRSGSLSRAEVAKSLPQLAPRFSQIDRNKDGELSHAELSAWTKARRSVRQAQAAERYRHADADGDGAISRAEAEAHAPRLARKFDRIDIDHDGRLTQDELRAYREAKLSSARSRASAARPN